MNNQRPPFANEQPSVLEKSSPLVDEDELLIYRRHPINLAGSIIITVFMLLLILFFAVFLLISDVIDVDLYLPYVVLYTGVLIFFAISYFFMNWVFWYLDVWIISKGKLIDSQLITFFVRRRAELALEQIQDIRFTIPGTLATIFSCGNILIQSAAKESNFRLMFIPNPRKAVKEIMGALNKVSSTAQKSVISINPNVPILRLGEELIRSRLLSPADLNTALTKQVESGKRLGEILIEENLLKRQDLVTALSSQYRLPEVNLRRYSLDLEVLNCLTPELANKYLAMPISKTREGVLIAIADPASKSLMEEICSHLNMPADFAVADKTDIEWAIQKYYSSPPQSGQNIEPDHLNQDIDSN